MFRGSAGKLLEYVSECTHLEEFLGIWMKGEVRYLNGVGHQGRGATCAWYAVKRGRADLSRSRDKNM